MSKVVADLKQYGTVQRAVLGIKGTDVTTYIDQQKEKTGKDIDLGTSNGVYVAEVSADGSVADVLKEGDVITAIGGHRVDKMSELQEHVATRRPGEKVEITYLRDGKTHRATVTLRNVQGTTSAVETIDTDAMGAALRPLTDAEKKELGLSYGLMVSAVKAGKMQEAGITKGLIITKVNDREMRTVDDFDAAVREANMSSERVLWIRAKTQSGLPRSFTVELSQKDKETKKQRN